MRRSSSRVAVLVALALEAGSVLAAGSVIGNVSKASIGFALETPSYLPGLEASVQLATPADTGPGFAQVSVTRTAVVAEARGQGTTGVGASGLSSRAVSASGRASTSYALFDTATGQALDFGQAQDITLAFSFRLTGSFSVSPLSLSQGGVGFGATVYSNSFSQASTPGLVTTYGPVPPPPGQLFADGYIDSGDASLRGAPVDRVFTIYHANNPTGSFELSLNVGAANAADSVFSWRLDSVSLVDTGAANRFVDGAAIGPLALRIADTNQLIAVTAVPEAGSAALLLLGLVMLAGVLRRQRMARSP